MGWLENNLKMNKHMSILFDSDIIDRDKDGSYLINVAYSRVSTEKQAEEGLGLEAQRDSIISYCRLNNIKNCVLFTDDGYTGTNLERPAIQGIIKMIKEYNDGRSSIRINTLIVPRIDRLARSLLDMLQFIEDYILSKDGSKSKTNTNKYDINFVSIKESFCRIDRNDPSSKLMLQLFGSLAEYDRDCIVEKLKIGREKRISTGKWKGGGNLPYGYKYNKETGILEIIPEEAERVREVFRLYIDEKMSPQRISDILGFKGERIVTQILKRRSLLGYVSVKGKEYKGLHEPIISEETFKKAEDELRKRSVTRGNSIYMLAGLLRCGECGARMRYQKWGKADKVKIVCYSQQHTKKYLIKDENCPNKKFWREDIENAVLDAIFAQSFELNEKNKKQDFEIDITAALEKQIKKEKDKLWRLYKAFLDNEDEDEVLQKMIKEIQTKIKEMTSSLSSEEKKEELRRKKRENIQKFKGIRDSWQYMTDTEKQTVCRELIDKIIVSRDNHLSIIFKHENYESI